MSRAALLLLLFLAAQFAPGLHSAFEAGHDAHSCCTHEERSPHFEVCDVDHEDAHCPVCDAARAPASVEGESETYAFARVAIPAIAVVDVAVADPFHVETPDTRGPPA
jgi:hypothetical protein